MKYQLVIQFPLAGASADDFDRLIMIESELGLTLRNRHQVDGHDIGSNEMNIFIHTQDPEEAFELAKKVLSEKDLSTIVVAFRDMDSDDYSIIWPKGFTGEFNIK